MGVQARKFFVSLALVLGVTPAFAGWRDEASPADIDRLVQLPQIRAAAINDAQHGQGRGCQRKEGGEAKNEFMRHRFRHDHSPGASSPSDPWSAACRQR